MPLLLLALITLVFSTTEKDSNSIRSNVTSLPVTERTLHSLAAILGHEVTLDDADDIAIDDNKDKVLIENRSIRYFISAINKLLGINEPQNVTLGQLHLALSSRGRNSIATGALAHAYHRGILGYPKTDGVAHFLYHSIVDAWASGAEHAYPYEYSNVDPLQIARYGSKHESETMSSAEREFMIDEAGLNPESGQALLALSCFLTGDYGFPKSNLFLARFAAIAAMVDGTGQNEEPGLFDLTLVNTKLQKYLTPSSSDPHPDGFHRVIDKIPNLDLYKYRANLALSDHAYIEAVVQIVRASEALLISYYADVFGFPQNITYSEYLSHPEYNIKVSNSTLIREAIKIYLRQSRHFVPFVYAIYQDLEKRVNVSYEEYAEALMHSHWFVRSPQETCTRRGQAFGIIASSLFSGISVPDEYASSTFVLQATRILYLMAVHEGCHMGLAGLAYQALMGFRMPVEDYLPYGDINSHMYPVTHYLNLSSSTLYSIGTRSLIPARLVGFTTVKRIRDLDLVLPRTLEAIMALDIASISGSFESSFYLSLILSRKVSEFSVRSFGLNYLWSASMVALIEHRFKQLDQPIYTNCSGDVLDLYGGAPINIQFANYLANHSANVGHLGGQIVSGYYLYTGQGTQFANSTHGNRVWGVAARRIVAREYVSQYIGFLTSGRASQKRLLLGAYLVNGMLGCQTSLKNAAKMILRSSKYICGHNDANSQSGIRRLWRGKERCLLPSLTMHGSTNTEYTGKHAYVYLAATLLANFCEVEDPGCAILMADAVKMDSAAALDALLKVDLQTVDARTVGTTLYNLLSINGTLMQYYLKHRLGAASPKYYNATLLRDIGLVRSTQELANTHSRCLLCKAKEIHAKFVKYYSTPKEPYKHVMGINTTNIITLVVSYIYNLIGFMYAYLDILFRLVENTLIKRMLRMLDMTMSLLCMKILNPVSAAIDSMWRSLFAGITTIRRLAITTFMLLGAKSYGKESLDLDLRARILDADDEPLTVQGHILGGNYGSTPRGMAAIPRNFSDSARLLDSCYMVPYLLAHHGAFNGSQELLDEHLKDLPYCIQLSSIVSSESAHALMEIYDKGPSKRQLTEFTEQDLHQYLLELDNAFLNVQLHYKLPTMNYLFNYVKGNLLYQRPELGYETRRNKDFRNILAFQTDEFLSQFANPSVLAGATSFSEFRTLMQASINKLASLISAGIRDSRVDSGAYPQILWDQGLDFDWQLLNGIRYTPLFTAQTLVIIMIKLKEHIAPICAGICALYYLILYDSTSIIFKNRKDVR
ncbi:Hypothetical protein GSB_151241 [Giardia duodenalis]|uniref:Uncharacterized protein n=2 Tax=Giardia intestinalis TaxID=5741 RepID=C6LMS0_GIAIB|nr:Hypothetical protein GL50581_18 [Giardia intestinalis ATCC 50581]ESU43151.1 Hypothetical protein GSB_151241 [Giardia intestinalis]